MAQDDPRTLREQELRQQLRRMRFIATLLLFVTFCLTVITALLEPLYPWLRFLHGFAEAATVGALADWFAVTALFRHPLGIPIPHTAILVAKKRQLAESLGIFLETHFLDPEILRRQLASINLLAQFATLLEQYRTTIQPLLLHFLQRFLRRLDKDHWIEQLLLHFRNALPQWNLSAGIGKGLAFIVQHQLHTTALDEILAYAKSWIAENRHTIHTFLLTRVPWYIPRPFRDNIAHYLVNALLRFLEEIEADPQHPVRKQVEQFLLDFAHRLQESEVYREKIRSSIEQLLQHPEIQALITSISQQVNAALYQTLENSPQKLEAFVHTLLDSLIRLLRQSDAVNRAINHALAQALYDLIVERRSRVRTFIVAVVDKWDDAEFVHRIELYTGRDLQFIRINGTLVGGLIGLCLTILLEFLR